MNRLLHVFLLTFSLFLVANMAPVYGQGTFSSLDYYWTNAGATANWSDPANWKTRAAGSTDPFTSPAADYPRRTLDNVFFNAQEYNDPGADVRVVIDTTDAASADFNATNATSGGGIFEITGPATRRLTIAGSYTLAESPATSNTFLGVTQFAGSGSHTITSRVAFTGPVEITAGTWVLGAPLTVNDITIQNGGTFDVSANNHEVIVRGNWTGNGIFVARNGIVTFNGAANQTVSVAANNNQFYSIRMSTSTTGTAGVTLASKVTVANTVFFDSGRIRTSVNNELIFPDYATVAPTLNATDESHVVGPVIKVGNDDFIYPIGDGTYYRPMGLSSPANNSNFRATYYQQSPNNISPPLGPATPTSTSNVIPPNQASIQQPLAGKVNEYEYWTLESLSGPRNAKTILSWDERVFPANVRPTYLPEPTQMVVALWNEGTRRWDNKGGVNQGASTRARGRVTATEAVNAANLTFFTLGSVVNALPVELLYFQAEAKEQGVELSWATATETNNDYFTVEKSADGQTFTQLLEVKGAGNSYELKQYQATDAYPYTGVSYYRLKQTDLDGKYSYSKIEAVHSSQSGTLLQAYQSTAGELQVRYSLPAESGGVLAVYDSRGRLVWSKNVDSNAARQQEQVRLGAARGLYMLSLQSSQGTTVKKVVVY